MSTATSSSLPAEGLSPEKMPGHWVLARMGKRVLRPGGRELTNRMLAGLRITPADQVVEFAPGLGHTARVVLAAQPASYTAVERDEQAATQVRQWLTGDQQCCLVGRAEASGLPDASANVVYGEAMLTMHGDTQKAAIVAEAFRLLRPGGRYGMHELAIVPDDAPQDVHTEVNKALSSAIRVGARPLTIGAWRALLEAAGFEVTATKAAPMHLLEPRRLIQDEGLGRTLLFIARVLTTPAVRRRVRGMRRTFRTHADHLRAVALVARKPLS